ncbi:hypothetical protein AURDEDRAFT_171870 [Auricularia subglabra TFB-10046 SS5]|uniref:Uncharacterized protein n=1 Tax=Auricularia subglabra (strain TFB-10046 / SS5) TaxID=717982 RepID=J0DBU8_AURST|nr:hypothetical protein AURDEDRAFT_171870 [Auricularia subglabra TFB-10046 SS5]
MPVVESPLWDSWPSTTPGEGPKGNFVLMKIDPVASVAIFEDEETTRAAAALERHEWVLGLVTGLSPGLPDATGKESLSLRLDLIGQGLPADKPIASLPFVPSPQLYDDRPPIELQPHLPWPDLYLHTYYSSSVLISRIHHGPGRFEIMLNEDEYNPIARRAFQDSIDWKRLPPVTVEDESNAIPNIELTGSFALTGSDDGEESSSDDGESLYAQQREDMGMKLLKARIYAEISLDPATCLGPLGCPADLEEPVRRIRDEWQERTTTEMLAKRPATNIWLQGVEAARHGFESDPEVPVDEVIPLDDTAVLPEDAVDDRSERARETDSTRRVTPPREVVVVAQSEIPGHAAPVQPPPGPHPSDSSAPSRSSRGSNANPGISAAATRGSEKDTAPLQLPETTTGPLPESSAQEERSSGRFLRFGGRVRPAVARLNVSFKRIMGTGQKRHALAQ